jgi:uncharacterized protein YchJ
MQNVVQFVVYYMIDDNEFDEHEAFNNIDDAWAYIAKCVDEAGYDSDCFEVRNGTETFSYS